MELFGQYGQFFLGLFIGTFLDTKTVIILSVLLLAIKNPEIMMFNGNNANNINNVPQDMAQTIWTKIKDLFVNR